MRKTVRPAELRRPGASSMLHALQKFLGLAGAGDAGTRGEDCAAEWLKRERAYAIVTRNWRNPADRREEIDLVCRDGEVLVFVEVKARAAGAMVPGYHAIDARKKRVLRRAIDAYLTKLGESAPPTFRFDVVEVSFPVVTTGSGADAGNGPARGAAPAPEILHFESVPLFPKHYRR